MLSRLLGGVVMCGLLFGQAVAQDPCDNPNIWCGPKKKDSQKPATTRPSTRRKPSALAQHAQPATSLNFQWGVMLNLDDDERKNASFNETYTLRDRFRLFVKIVENGYLYVIRQSSADPKGSLVFPSKYYNRSDDRVLAGDQFILPDCLNNSISLAPSATYEKFTVILSHKPIREFQLKLGSAMPVPQEYISGLRIATGQQNSIPGGGGVEDYNTYFVKATSLKTERLIETVTFTNRAGVIKIVPGSVAAN